MSFTYIKENLSIEKVAEKYTKLTNIAPGKAKGLCPFHNEKTPSFFVNLDTQFFYCFGCKAGGDVITLISLKENIPMSGVAEYVEQAYGINVPERVTEKNPIKENQFRVLKLFYERFSTENKQAIDYLSSRIRNFENKHKIDAFYVSKNDLLKFFNFLSEEDKKTANDLGLVWGKNGRVYPAFGDRVVFPLFRYKTLIGFNGRTLSNNEIDLSKKYLLSNSGEVFKKSEFIYGLSTARDIAKANDKNFVYVTEGVLDAISLQEHGIPAVCVLGSYINARQFQLLGQNFDNIYICLDGDESGESGAIKSLHEEVFLHGLNTSGFIVKMKRGQDVTDFLNTHSILEFKALETLSFEDSIINFYIKNTQKAFSDTSNITNLKLSFLKNILPKLLHYKTNRFAHSIVVRIASRIGFDLDKLFTMIDNSVVVAKKEIVEEISNTNPDKLLTLSPLELNLLSLSLSYPKLIQEIKIKPWYTHLNIECKDILDIINESAGSQENISTLIKRKTTNNKVKEELYYKTIAFLDKRTDYDKILEDFTKINDVLSAKMENSRGKILAKATQAFVKKNKTDVKKIIEQHVEKPIEVAKEKPYIVY